ncbi:MAG: hypothetical protein HDS82_06965 [Bacteroidales bacterium]|nr:hypothetical protein [Bacteroidales bacterium]
MTAAQHPGMQEIKHRFFAMRNGIVADALRKGGLPHSVIFGLQLPQLSEIARSLEKDAELSRTLWADSGVRESRLLACYLMPVDTLSAEEAQRMGESVATREESDILAFRLLRYHPEAERLAAAFEKSENPATVYLSEALRRNLAAMSE